MSGYGGSDPNLRYTLPNRATSQIHGISSWTDASPPPPPFFPSRTPARRTTKSKSKSKSKSKRESGLLEATMGIFTRKRDLEREREEKERLQHELDLARQTREWEEQQRRSDEAAARQRQEDQERTRALERLEERRRQDELRAQIARQREEERRREEELRTERARLEHERQKARQVEEARQAQEAKKIQQEQQRLKLEQRERERKAKQLKEASPETLRVLRELIRHRYELDWDIWNNRHCRRPDRHLVERKMDQSDDVMEEIIKMVSAWGDNKDKRWTEDEWARVTEIRRRLQDDKIRRWSEGPPWGERRSDRYVY